MPSPNDIVIALSHVTMRRDRRIILDDVNFDVRRGDFVAITGPNGGGKTTLLRIILGLLKPSAGKVTVSPDARVGYLPQKNMIDSRFPISVTEVVASGLLAVKGLAADQRREMVKSAIARVGLEQLADRPIGELSGGQLQRALLARAIISGPNLLVLDEPLSYIDKRFEQQLYDIIAQVASNATVLLVSHEMSTISDMANRHLIIDRALHECHAPHHYVRSECDG